MSSNDSQLLPKGAVILDVRSPLEYREHHYPGAVNLPVGHIPLSAASVIASKTTPVAVYCETGGRSSTAAMILQALGYCNITNIGGIREMEKYNLST